MLEAVRTTLGRRHVGNADGEGVTVAIFDTWPMPTAASSTHGASGRADPLGKIKARYAAMFPGSTKHWRLAQAAGGQIVAQSQIHDFAPPRAAGISFCPGATPSQLGDFSDHGLFIADIISDIAPMAELVVYRVFSDDGFGDLHRLAAAINDAITDARARGRRLVLNMSFGFGPQLELVDAYLRDLERGAEQWIPRQQDASPPPSADAEVSDLLREGLVVRQGERYQFTGPLEVLDTVFSAAGGHSIVLGVAATGNDSTDHPGEPFGPRLPAASDGVIAVRAFRPPVDASEAWQPENYSNDDDLFHNNDGIGALGGALNDFAAVAERAIYGLYVSELTPPRYFLPGEREWRPGEPNTSGWAYWSGTSFACPIVAAFAACVWSAAPTITAGQLRNLIVNNAAGKEYLDFEQRTFPAGP